MERLTPWHRNLTRDTLKAEQRSIDQELNHLCRMMRVLRNRKQWLIEQRDRNLDKYLLMKTQCKAVACNGPTKKQTP